jgi:signal transduction histidine kinase
MPPEISITAEIINGEKLGAGHPIKSHYRFSGWNEDRYWKNEKFCRLVLTDNGIGFAPEYSDKIFVVFQRLNQNTTLEGTGIGLAICKKIIDNHHGTIQATGAVGIGATFTIVLPVSQGHFE